MESPEFKSDEEAKEWFKLMSQRHPGKIVYPRIICFSQAIVEIAEKHKPSREFYDLRHLEGYQVSAHKNGKPCPHPYYENIKQRLEQELDDAKWHGDR